MKKLIALICALVLSVSLCACNKSKSSKAGEVTVNQLSVGDFDTTPTIIKTVLYDENNIKITANNLAYTDYSAELELTFENNTDKTLSFICGSVNYDIISVNECMADDGYINCSVPAGESKNDKMSFDFSSLKAYGVTCIADIITGFDISDEEYLTNIKTGPLQIKTSAANSYDYSQNRYRDIIKNGKFEGEFECTVDYFSDDELYNNSGFRVKSTTVSTNSSGEPILMLEMENNSDEQKHFKIKEVYINDNLVYEALWTSNSVTPEKKYVESFSLTQLANKYDDFDKVSKISKISFKFEIGKTFNDTINSQEISISLPDIEVSAE